MKKFKNSTCKSEIIVGIKRQYKQHSDNIELKTIYNSIIEDTYTAIDNIEEVLHSNKTLVQLLRLIQQEDTSFATSILGLTNAGNNNSYYRAFLTIDGMNVIELRFANHYETRSTSLDKSNNLTQFLFQIVLVTDPPKPQKDDSITKTTNVGNVRILTKGILTNSSTPNDIKNLFMSIHDFLISPSKSYEESLENNIKTEQTMKNTTKIRLTESQLHQMILDAVNESINELDWRTYANYQKGRMDQAKQAEAQGDYDKANMYRNKAVIGGNAAGAAARKQYGFKDLDDFNKQQRAVRNNMTSMYGDEAEKVKQRVQSYNNDSENYYNGSSKYIKGQGWNESVIRESVRKTIRKYIH